MFFPREMKTYTRAKNCTKKFTAGLFIIAKNQTQSKWLSMGQCINYGTSIYATESAICLDSITDSMAQNTA